MNTNIIRSSQVVALFCGLASLSFAADVTFQKVPPLTVEQAPSYPQNLARYHLGAQVEATPQASPAASLQLSSQADDRNTAEAALLCNDPTIGYALPSGATTLLVSLPNIENVDTVSFLNKGAKGNVTIATSNAKLPMDSPQWNQVGQQELSSDVVKAKVGPAEAKYVKITLNVAEPGRIAGFGIYSTPAASDFTMPRPRKVKLTDSTQSFGLITSNLSDLHAKARALYVSSATDVKEANNMIDDQPASAFNFAAEDAAPMAIIDLGKVTQLSRLSAIYSPRPGTVDFYVLQSLPNEQRSENVGVAAAPPQMNPAVVSATVAPNTYTLSEAAFSNMKPVGSVTNTEGQGRASVDFPTTSGRYVILKWTPASRADGNFSVAEIAAFGGSKKSDQMIVAEGPPEGTQYADGKTVLDGKTMLDGKDIPAEGPEEPMPPAEGPPPNLPQPPPFTFIPEVPPTSP